MYVLQNGQRADVKLGGSAAPLRAIGKESFEFHSEGSNKVILYLALVMMLVVVGVSGWALYKHIKSSKQKVGYKLY